MSNLDMPKLIDLNEPLAQLDVLARLHALPDAVALTTSEAAVFLRSSVSALEAMRAKGTGPTYIQGGGRGSLGANQKCLYEKADLLAWQRSNKVSSTVEAAVRKGQLFTTLGELAQPEAFWVDAHGQVVGMVEAASVSTVIERLGVFDIEWMRPADAACRAWDDIAEHLTFGSGLVSVLRREIDKIEAGYEASEIAAAIGPSKETP
ncbi:helix-turn-helix domain-containing protein [Massilia aurea]|uniref:helix-turn-helix domain-containing protein n=1 Tax=Massilia aurea TaxID=373040 RepID=UPI000F2DDAA8|nr:helix-turn-helix domain-containing protein [Massilia aurea]